MLNTVLVYVVLPAAIVLVIAALARTGSDRSRPSRRYRPGRPYEFTPVWFLANPEQISPAPEGTAQPRAIESGNLEDSSGQRVLPGSVGGASDRW